MILAVPHLHETNGSKTKSQIIVRLRLLLLITPFRYRVSPQAYTPSLSSLALLYPSSGVTTPFALTDLT